MKCPNCRGNTNIIYINKNMPYGIKLKDIKHDVILNKCEDCNFIFQSSSFNNEYDKNISKLYESYNITDMYNFPNRNIHHLKALTFISEYINNEIDFNILEIGSNRGDFLYLLKEKFPKINIIGCEPTQFKELKVPTLNSFFDKDLFNTKFDLIILRHTLEHIKNPKIFIDEVNSLLKDNGKLFIEVPNIIYSLKNNIEDFTPDHVNFFSLKTLKESVGRKILKVDDKEYLYMIFSNQCDNECINEKNDLDILFNNYKKNYDRLLSQIQNYNRIIFYGISNYYLWTYCKLKKYIQDKELFYKDDYLENDYLNNLPKIENFQENDLVILCSSNKLIQEKMATTLPKNIAILYPWEKIENV